MVLSLESLSMLSKLCVARCDEFVYLNQLANVQDKVTG